MRYGKAHHYILSGLLLAAVFIAGVVITRRPSAVPPVPTTTPAIAATTLAATMPARIVHDYMDRHYRDVLDQPVPALDGQTPRTAVKTEGGRMKVVEWLKLMENRTAKHADPDNPMASYNFAWLWTELGLSERRE